MKKILTAFLCLLLLAALTTPVFAAQSAKMTVTASKTELKPGDKVTFTVSVTKVENITTGGFLFSFDENIFSYESGKRLPALEEYMAGVTTASNKIAGFFMNGRETVEGELFSVTFQVRDDAAPGTYTVSGKPNLTAGDKVDCTVVDAQVTVTAGVSAPEKPKPTLPTLPSIPAPTIPVTDLNPVDKHLPTQEQTSLDEETPETQPQKQTLPQPQVQQDGVPRKPDFPWWIIGVIAVVAAGGAVFLILEIKKTKNSP